MDANSLALMSLGLRLMSTPGKFGTALGQAGLGALGDFSAAKESESRKKQMEAADRMRALQEQSMLLQLTQAQQEQQKRRAVEEAYRGAMVSPAQQALAGGGGPTMQNAQAMQGMQPKLDQARLIQNLLGADPMMAAQMMQPKPADYKVVGDALLELGPQGPREVYRKPKDTNWNDLIVMGPDGKPQLNTLLLDAKRSIAREGKPSMSVSYGTPVAGVDASGNPVFLQPTKDGSPPKIIEGIRPPRSAAEERAAGEQRDRERQGRQMMSVMEDAETLLKAGRATGSGLGTVVDAAGRAVGVSTPGAQDSAKLQALSGWLVANVPRMEGPQSNYDVQNYMVMAGKIGDSTVPLQERIEALSTVKQLQRRYAEINGTPMPQTEKRGQPSIDDLLKKYGN